MSLRSERQLQNERYEAIALGHVLVAPRCFLSNVGMNAATLAGSSMSALVKRCTGQPRHSHLLFTCEHFPALACSP